jgi:nicotinamide-nucleotide amidase
MFPAEDLENARRVLHKLRSEGLKLTTAESCTGGLIAALLTEIPGSSDVLERGYVVYSDIAKIEALGVPRAIIDRHGAVSAAVVVAMAEGALTHARAEVAVAVTGIAGPGGGTVQKPVGLVYVAVGRRGGYPVAQRFSFGDIGRAEIRRATVREALALVEASVAA